MANFIADLLSSVSGMSPSFMQAQQGSPNAMGDPVFGPGWKGWMPSTGQGPSMADIQNQANANAGIAPGGSRRSSLVNVIGGLADTFAELGGSKPMYQPTIDAETERQRQAEGDQMTRELFPIKKQGALQDIRASQSEVMARRAKLMGPIASKLSGIYKAGGPAALERILPAAYQTLGLSPEEIQQYHGQIMADPENALSMLAAMGEANDAEYGTTVQYARGPDGQLYPFQASKAGGLVQAQLPPGFTIEPGVINIDDGTQNRLIRKPDGSTVSTTPKSGTPAQGDIAIPDPSAPGGVIYTQAPGSQAAAEQAAKAAEAEAKAGKIAANEAKARQQAAIVRDTISVAREKAKSRLATGVVGQATQWLGSTPANDLRALIDTVKANISIDNLMEMRANSPTGGAMGNVSDKDIALLASTMSSLDITQSPEQLARAFDVIDRLYEKIESGAPAESSAPKGGGWKIERID